MIFNPGFQVSRRLLIQKRLLSILVSTALLLVFSPVMLLLILLIKLDSKGPAFYRQRRVGKDGASSRSGNSARCARTPRPHPARSWAAQDDPRVTRVGRLMRRTRLDELPQLYNIFVGDMSLVGPRPERPKFVRTTHRVESPFTGSATASSRDHRVGADSPQFTQTRSSRRRKSSSTTCSTSRTCRCCSTRWSFSNDQDRPRQERVLKDKRCEMRRCEMRNAGCEM